MSWYEDFELVTLPSIPRPGNIYRNEKCVVLSIEDYNKFIDLQNKAKAIIRDYESIGGFITDAKHRIADGAARACRNLEKIEAIERMIRDEKKKGATYE